MANPPDRDASAIPCDISRLVEAAARVKVEFDQQEAVRWIRAVASAAHQGTFRRDRETGVFGHCISLVDFDSEELETFRALAPHVRVVGRPDVESALAIAGSAAQGKSQVFPGDYDFFERVNISAPSAADAQAVLRALLRETALRARNEPNVVLVEVNFGVYPQPVVERGVPRAAGDPITWMPGDVERGQIDVRDANGESRIVRWSDVPGGPGWTYLGWIVVDQRDGRLALASNMIEATWESPAGVLTALDGSIDPCFQEIYLEADAAPLFSKIASRVDPAAMAAYVSCMRTQAFHYTHEAPDFGKASKRLYNLFRLTGDLESAAYVRELFDEPGAQMYQVPGLLDAARVAITSASKIGPDVVLRQFDLVRQIIDTAGVGSDLAPLLVQLRTAVERGRAQDDRWAALLDDVRRRCIEIVSEYFRERLIGLPRISEFIDTLRNPVATSPTALE